MTSATCGVCRQLVAPNRPHSRHGKPCAGGRPAPVIAAKPLKGRNERKRDRTAAAKAIRLAHRRHLVEQAMPAGTIDLARVLGLHIDVARKWLTAQGYVRATARAPWGMP